MSQHPVGVFDSGIGGLSTLQALRRQLPREDFVYVADLDWAPYGNRSADTLQARGEHICRFLAERHCKAIVIACNTATAAAAATLRAHWPLPIIGVEPGIKPATGATLSGVVAVLATEYTLASERFQYLLEQFSAATTVISQACPGLAEAIEDGPDGYRHRRALLRRYLEPIIARGTDTLVLGCTHYPLIGDEIAAVAPALQRIDTSDAIARQVVRQLTAHQLTNHRDQPGHCRFYASVSRASNPPQLARLSRIFSYYWHEPVIVEAMSETHPTRISH